MTMTPNIAAPAILADSAPEQGFGRRSRYEVLGHICRSPKGLIGLVLILGYTVLALLGPMLAPLDPMKQDFVATLKPPSAAHWFGTDQLGRDVFSRVMWGARASLGIGIGGVAVAFVIGVPFGLAAAWFRGTFERVTMRAVDILLSFPDIVSALAIVAVLGASTRNVILAVGITSVPMFIRTTRAVALSTLSEPFVEGAEALGCSPLRIVARHVLPNLAGILVTLASLLFASTLLAASGLGFLGLGVQPPTPEWGAMLGDARSYIRTHPYLATFPGLFLAVSALAFNLLGEELRNIYDPTASHRRPFGRSLWQRLTNRGATPVATRPTPRAVEEADVVVRAEGLEISYLTESGAVPAVREVDLVMRRGRTLAVVGESGSGKSTLLRAVATLLPRGRATISAGRLTIAGQDVARLSPKALRMLRRAETGIVFQDAASALNPVMTVGAQLTEAITVGNPMPGPAARARAVELLAQVQISDPERRLDMYPHQFSGGMKQRIVIAIALAQEPRVLLADEPTSALDVTVQQQILVLLREMQRGRDMALMLVTHDLGLVARYADDVAVMYAGRIVEMGPVETVFGDPRHPYTQALRAASPRLDLAGGAGRTLPAIPGEPPLIGRLPPGCAFAPRCARAGTRADCRSRVPATMPIAGRAVACHAVQEEARA